MPSNETRARLVGCVMRVPWSSDATSDESGEYELCVPPFDTSRDACAELLEYVEKRERRGLFVRELAKTLQRAGSHNSIARKFWILAATPAQICAAFDATFAEELAELESKHAK